MRPRGNSGNGSALRSQSRLVRAGRLVVHDALLEGIKPEDSDDARYVQAASERHALLRLVQPRQVAIIPRPGGGPGITLDGEAAPLQESIKKAGQTKKRDTKKRDIILFPGGGLARS